MAKQTIKLNRKAWTFDDRKPLGSPGGFGQVFRCPGEYAIKRLNVIAAAAKRELTLADALAGNVYQHVVPVLDAGEDADSGSFYVVMPVCEHSLSDYLATA